MAAIVPYSALGNRALSVRNGVGETIARSKPRAFAVPAVVPVKPRRFRTRLRARVANDNTLNAPVPFRVDSGVATRRGGGTVLAVAPKKTSFPDAAKKSSDFAPAAAALAIGGLASLFVVSGAVEPAFATDLVAAAQTTAVEQIETASLTDGFLSAFLLIFFSEIGDKTFFIAVLLATQQPKSSVFLGTFGALGVMTLISVGIGQVFHVAEETTGALLQSDVPWDDYLATALLLFFGVQTLLSAEEETAEEEEEDAKIAVAGMEFNGTTALILSTFALVFAAEWGDKSFIATIALSAAASPAGVALGGAAGHGVATGIAVLVGDILGDVVSERVVKYTGGALFIVFAVVTALGIK
jgi:putative Ca2+/H+ antiporter (TMEM165/GDT1 family)|tara:strand:+ start:1281 stop:2345 length:1065 start_codon:yes stop_codon:yes gene_type:complete